MRFDGFHKIVWPLAVAETILWAGLYYVFAALLVEWDREFQWSKLELTGAFTLAVATSAIAAPLAGRAVDNGFGRKLLAGSALTGAAFLALLTQAAQLWQFYLIWFGIGLTMAGCLYEPCFALLTRTLGAKARRGITIVSLLAGFAGTVSFPLAHLLSQAYGWRATAITFATAVCVIAVPLLWYAAGEAERQGNGSTPPASLSATDAMRVAANPVFWCLSLGFGLLATNHGMLLTHTLPLLDERGFNKETAIFAMSMIGPMQVLGRLIMINVERRLSSLAISMACQFAVGVAAFCLMGATAMPVLLAAFVVFQGIGNGVASIIRPALTADLLGRQNFGVISGMLATVYISGFAAGPTLGSLVWQAASYSAMLYVAAGLAASGAILLILAGAATRRSSQTSSRSTGG